MKQETTIEEAAETLGDFIKRESKSYIESVGIVKGVKWQQERMYEIMDAYADDVMGGCTLRAKEWFEQFKK